MRLAQCIPLSRVLLIALLFCNFAHAKGQLQAGPILLQIGAGQKASRLRLSNTGDERLVAQVRVFAWSQENGEDQLTASDAVVASPPIVELMPGMEQIVRLVRLGESPSGADQSFRLVVDELPLNGGAAPNQVSVRMRYVLPLFVRAQDAPEAKISCAVRDNAVVLECINSGGRAAQLGASFLIDSSGWEVQLSAGLLGYVLPGSRKVWALPENSGVSSANNMREVRLETILNGQPTQLSLQQ
ncbi:fimbrial biogenesis chaperone [Microbulbifer thermotolerans]|uniref:fimbrial biogenesis chaperone n=1 Tax=Microbulbifer thermotolerans TaxID=252514 RepID=UPI0008EE3F07|nr:fimbria/pilus periplasmic chaperone [Microbulbifer thermotolerans]MCX2780707.1 fimbria/pilus periplasmic chaperone [Microbulbifer thermotolerans]MCX2806305.1 fimbria/pilus periplasmic chaperone [Microbulbifer thermotolerans]MCX2832279.1 fimbria/pilus periplasmic chaperone [Microbulbifer thermotolerans]SFC09383.1 fimbrial chaperone protein [Microbulbifer thermotolerans]